MMYDLIEVKPKINKTKVIIAIIIVLILILLLSIPLIKHIKKNNINIVAKNDIQNTIEPPLPPTEEKIKTKHIPQIELKPVYSEAGKNAINNIYQSEEKVVYLTFDDGPSKSVTPLILDLLKQENIKASFFVLGSRVELNPDVLKRAHKEGHYIANHGYSHVYSQIYASVDDVLKEYNKTQEAIKNALGTDYNGHIFRFPGGSTGGKYKTVKSEAKDVLQANEILYIDWNALSQDAAGAHTKEELIENTKSSVADKNSVVILMHDAGDKILTYEALPEIISYLREKGYVFKNFYSLMK